MVLSASGSPSLPADIPSLPADIDIRFNEAGLVPVIAQQWDSGEVLMLAWMDREALRRTILTGQATYWSRSRRRYWVKGETSGNRQFVRRIAFDCDADALLLQVDQLGPACHTGLRSCFDTARSDTAQSELARSELAQSELAQSELAQSELAQSEPNAGVAAQVSASVAAKSAPATAPAAAAGRFQASAVAAGTGER